MFLQLSLYALFFGSRLCAFEISDRDRDIVQDIEEKIDSLDESQHFIFVDLGLLREDLEYVNRFKITSSGQYDFFGDTSLLQEQLPDFLRSVGNNDEQIVQKLANLISHIASLVNRASHKEAAWVCVRASEPHRGFDIPRWHWDGYYYFPYSGFAFKFAMVLQGNSTLFCQLPKDTRAIFEQNRDNREFLSHLMSREIIETARLGQGAFFIVGDRNIAAAHSEPKIDSERLFFSVLPGNEKEINELKARWKDPSSQSTVLVKNGKRGI